MGHPHFSIYRVVTKIEVQLKSLSYTNKAVKWANKELETANKDLSANKISKTAINFPENSN
ncbi:hypothetical protein [Bacillus sp. AFS017336]|uniref:hypothetical protein n=1 Tax=Bacillus sp. AFS017336 TaxID=2033489 RepID=UPI000BF199FA|nr:hypothetical protein [Bacillus sp. AFS017336]PEK99896.1 hypothetical protein CN601_22840 [Bacillus sp. AFS017336]